MEHTRLEGAGGDRSAERHAGRVDWLALGILTLLVLAFFWRVVFLGEVMVPLDILRGVEPWMGESAPEDPPEVWNRLTGDGVTQQYPEAVASIRAWGDGPPLWDPTVLTGMPALATGRAWSSPLIIVLGQFFSVGRAISLATVFYVLIGAFSCFLLLGELGCGRIGALIGSVTFAFNPYFVGWFSHPSLVGGWVWIPLVFLGFEAALRRTDWRWVVLGGGALAMQIFCGYFLWPLYTGITLAFYGLGLAVIRFVTKQGWMRTFAPLAAGAGIGLLGVGLSAPLWLLTAELFVNSARTVDLFAGVYVPLVEMARLLVPHLWGLPLYNGPYHGALNFVESNLSVGAAPLVLAAVAIAARGRRRPLIIAGVGLVAYLAVFGFAPAIRLVDLVDPTYAKTFPGRMFFVFAFGMSLAAGIGADWLDRTRPVRFLRRASIVALMMAIAGLAVAAVIQLRGLPGILAWTRLPSTLLDPSTYSGRGVLLAAAIGLTLAVILRALAKSKTSRWPGAALFGVVVVELFALGVGFNSTFPGSMAFPEVPSLEALGELIDAEDQPARVVNVPSGGIIPGQIPMVWDIQVPSGYSSWLLDRYARYTGLIPSETGAGIEVYFSDCDHRLLDALNTELVYAPRDVSLQREGPIRLARRLGGARIASRGEGGVAPAHWQVDGEEQPVIYTAGATSVSFGLEIPNGGRLVTRIGLDPDAWPHSDGMCFQIGVGTENESDSSIRFHTCLDPRERPKDRRFVPVDVDLADLAGTVVYLTLTTGQGPVDDPTCDWGAWVDPIVSGTGESTLELLYDGPNRILRNMKALPRTWLVHRVFEVESGDLDAVSSHLESSSFDPSVEAVVEGRVGPRLGRAGIGDGVRVVDYRSDRVELEVRASRPALLVLSDMVYPGWRAMVDGVERPILPTNMIMRGVVVAASDRQVVFSYEPPGLVVGLVLSGLVALGCVVALAFSVVRRL